MPELPLLHLSFTHRDRCTTPGFTSPCWNPNPDVRTGRRVVHNLHAHLVFVTKYRRKAFTDDMPTRTEEIMRDR